MNDHLVIACAVSFGAIKKIIRQLKSQWGLTLKTPDLINMFQYAPDFLQWMVAKSPVENCGKHPIVNRVSAIHSRIEASILGGLHYGGFHIVMGLPQ